MNEMQEKGIRRDPSFFDRSQNDVITADEMKAVDQNCHHLGIDPSVLMENAGAAVASEILSEAASLKCGGPFSENGRVRDRIRVLLFAGRGNNGGDAFVAARHLSSVPGIDVSVIAPERPLIRTEEAGRNDDLLKFCPVSVVRCDADRETISSLLSDADIIVDGILGTGIRGKARGAEREMISLILEERRKRPDVRIISIDIPSGMPSGACGDVCPPERSCIISADTTVTFHKMKTFLKTPQAALYAGKIIVSGIGILPAAETFAGPGHLRLLHARRSGDHKGCSGSVLVIGGGPYTGAPFLAASAALRSGADVVRILTPETAAGIIASFSPDLIVTALPSGKDHLCPDDVPFIRPFASSADSVIIGPGLGNHPETIEAVSGILPFCRKAVVDADALRPEIFSGISRSEETRPQMILTPHGGEFARLAEILPASDNADADNKTADNKAGNDTEKISLLAAKTGAVILKKGAVDTISDGERIRFNSTGNPGMNVGGTGDILSGIAGALLASNDAFEAAVCAAFINGSAGDLASAGKGPVFTATDVLAEIPAVFRKYLRRRPEQKDSVHGLNGRINKLYMKPASFITRFSRHDFRLLIQTPDIVGYPLNLRILSC